VRAAGIIVVDIVRIENGLLAEHWDVIEDEVTREKSASGQPMFGAAFPSRRSAAGDRESDHHVGS